MRTTDLFNFNRSSKRLNESLHKTFGTRINFEDFDTPKLEDARNKLRTQIHTARTASGFNETVENETLTKAQFMHDAIVAELMDRQEHIVDTTIPEGVDSLEEKVQELLQRFEQNAMEIGGYGDPDIKEIVKHLENGDAESAAEVVWYAYSDQDGGEFPEKEPLIDDLQAEFEELVQDGDRDDDEGGETDDGYALASAGFGSDEDYGDFPEAYDMDQLRKDAADGIKKSLDKQSDDRIAKLKQGGDEDEPFMAQVGRKIIGGVKGAVKGFAGKTESAPPTAKGERMVKHIKKGYADDGKLTDKEKSIAYATAWKAHNKNESIDEDPRVEHAKNVVARWAQQNGVKNNVLAAMNKAAENDQLQHSEYVALDILDSMKESNESNEVSFAMRDAAKDFVKKWTNQYPGNPSETAAENESDYERVADMFVKNILQSHGEKLTSKSLQKGRSDLDYFVNQEFEMYESINTGDDMRNLREGEIQQASAIVTAKTMVDRVGRWIEELSGMENETLLQLGDSIRDEMGQEQAKAFIEAVAPAIQQALDNLKQTRDTLSTGVRSLASGEQPDTMLGAEPEMGDEGGMDMAEPDMMNEPELGAEEDPFAAAEPGAGGMETAGREQRESIDRQSRLMKILAG